MRPDSCISTPLPPPPHSHCLVHSSFSESSSTLSMLEVSFHQLPDPISTTNVMDRTITNSTVRLGQAMPVLISMLSTFLLGSPCSRKSMRSSITMMSTARSCSSARSREMKSH